MGSILLFMSVKVGISILSHVYFDGDKGMCKRVFLKTFLPIRYIARVTGVNKGASAVWVWEKFQGIPI